VIAPHLDDILEIGVGSLRRILPAEPRRLEPERATGKDWHNDSAEFLIDLKEALDKAADDRSRAVILRRLKRALEEA